MEGTVRAVQALSGERPLRKGSVSPDRVCADPATTPSSKERGMTQVRRFAGVLFALLLALTLIPAAAEDMEESAGPLDDLSQLEGIEAAVSRSWSIDFMAMMEVTPENEGDDPFADMTGTWLIMGMVMEFDDDDNAEDAYAMLRDLDDEEYLADLDNPEAQLEREDLDDIGDEAQGITLISEAEDDEGLFRYVFARDDEYVYVTVAISSDADSGAVADDLAEAMIDNTDDQSGIGEFDVDGASTDGLWDIFPDDDDDMFEGLIPAGDEVLYPEQDEEVEE
jgi:hypothetical protein